MGMLFLLTLILALYLTGLIVPALWLLLIVWVFALIIGGFCRLLFA